MKQSAMFAAVTFYFFEAIDEPPNPRPEHDGRYPDLRVWRLSGTSEPVDIGEWFRPRVEGEHGRLYCRSATMDLDVELLTRACNAFYHGLNLSSETPGYYATIQQQGFSLTDDLRVSLRSVEVKFGTFRATTRKELLQ